MEREILFRGERLENGARGAWVEGSLCVEHYPSFEDMPERWRCDIHVPEDGRPWHSSVYSVDPATVGQYTGLTDRNGKKIFEGDLLKRLPSKNEGPYEVYCENEDYAWRIRLDYYQPDDFIGFDSEEWVVIGNIWDNPELLEVKK